MQKRKVLSLESKSEGCEILIIISINVSSITTVKDSIVKCFADVLS